MESFDEVVRKGYASIEELHDALSSVRFGKLEDRELVQMTESLFKLPTVIEEVSEHPEFYMKGFDLFLFYNGVKGQVTPRLAEGQAARLVKLRRMIGRAMRSNGEKVKKPHEIVTYESYELEEVKEHFSNIDVYDSRRFRATLDGMTLALHCPEIVPEHAKEAFGPRWYTVKQFHGDYEYGIKEAKELKDDGRKSMFMEGAASLVHYLRTH